MRLQDDMTESFVNMLERYGITVLHIQEKLVKEAQVNCLYTATHHLNKNGMEVVANVLSEKLEGVLKSSS